MAGGDPGRGAASIPPEWVERHAAAVGRPFRIAYLLLPRFVLLPYATSVEPMRAANTLSGLRLYEWTHVTLDGRPVETLSGGGWFDADHKVGDDLDVDFLIVCSLQDSELFQDDATFRWLRQLAHRGTIMGAFAGGIWVLARAGLLKGYRAAVYWPKVSTFLEEFPEQDITNSIFVVDRNRVTVGGGLAGMDFMHAIIEAQHGRALASSVSEWLNHTEIREGRRPQRLSLQARLGVHHPGLIRALQAMQDALEEPLERPGLAAIAGVSERHLDRLFVSQIGTTLSDYYLRLRLERAYELVVMSGMSLLEIAMACGFDRADTFSKAYRRVHGVAPRTDRRDALHRSRRRY